MENLILVDRQDRCIGYCDKLTTHFKGFLHRAFSVFVLRENAGKIQVLLQKRHKNKYHSGGLWTNSCCGHPGATQQLLAAAKQRVTEELGISIKLSAIGKFNYYAKFANGLIEYEIDHVLMGEWLGEPIVPAQEEIEDLKWVDFEEFNAYLFPLKGSSSSGKQSNQIPVTAWLRPAWRILQQQLAYVQNPRSLE